MIGEPNDTACVAGSLPRPASRMAKARPNQRRFDRLIRLVTEPGYHRLESAHVVVFGLGGVGGFAAEGLARCGIGRITLVDFDIVCATNVNRQIQAMSNTVGQSKAALLAERLRIINKQAEVVAIESFYNARSAARLLPLDDPPSCVIDAIDNVAAKMHLMDRCRSHGIPLVSSMGAAGKLDPTAIEVADLYDSHTDPLARVLRKRLRGEYGWPGHDGKTSVKSGVTVVFSTESRRLPVAPSWDDEHGFQCICPHGDNGLHSCSQRNIIEGSAVFVTATFGMVASGEVVKRLVGSYAAPRIDEESQAGEVSCGQPGSATAANAMKA